MKNLYEFEERFKQEFNLDAKIQKEKEYIQSILNDTSNPDSAFYEDVPDEEERERLSRLRIEYFETYFVINRFDDWHPIYRICYHLMEGENIMFDYEIEYLEDEFVDEYIIEREYKFEQV